MSEVERAQYIARGLLVALLVLAGAVGLCCWKGGDGIPTPADVELYRRAEVDCSQDGKAKTRAEVDACRAQKRAEFCGKWPGSANCDGSLFEGGTP